MDLYASKEMNYDPSKEYYFVDYRCIVNRKWVRCPYLTIEEVSELVDSLHYAYDINKSKILPMFRHLRITPHTQLAELYSVWNEEDNKWENETITKGCVQFDFRYDYPESFGMPASLTKKNDESHEEWEARVAVREEEIKEGLQVQFAEDGRRKQIWKEHPVQGITYSTHRANKKKQSVSKQALVNEESEETSPKGFG